MTSGADVRSIDALREWLAAAHTYRDNCDESLAGIRMEIRRGIDWVGQQADHWQTEGRRAEEDVVQAKADLSARKFPNWSGGMPDTTVQERNLRRAEARRDHAHDQVIRCKKWLVQLPRLIDESFTGAGHRLAMFIEGELARGLAALSRQLDALDRYAETRPDFAPTPSTSGLPSGGNPPASTDGAGS